MTNARASDALSAEIAPTRRARILVLLRWVPSVVAAFVFGTVGEWRGTDVVVSDKATGGEVLRLVGKTVGEADDCVQLMRTDLRRLQRDEFLREWGAVSAEF